MKWDFQIYVLALVLFNKMGFSDTCIGICVDHTDEIPYSSIIIHQTDGIFCNISLFIDLITEKRSCFSLL